MSGPLPALDPSVFEDPATGEIPEQPMVIAWEALDPDDYTATVRNLAAWFDWLVETYRPPTQILPPCWYAHPGILEDLGHLWTGWLITRHPLSGVGMTGLDWDTRRDTTFTRLRETVATTGCDNRHHNPPMTRPPLTNAQTMREYLERRAADGQQAAHARAKTTRAAAVIAAAELRHNHAPVVLRQVAADPAAATAGERDVAAHTLRAMAFNAVAEATHAAATLQTGGDNREEHLSAARDLLVAAIAAGDQPRIDGAAEAWLGALDSLIPPDDAIARAVAAGANRAAAAAKLTAQARNPTAERLLDPGNPQHP